MKAQVSFEVASVVLSDLLNGNAVALVSDGFKELKPLGKIIAFGGPVPEDPNDGKPEYPTEGPYL